MLAAGIQGLQRGIGGLKSLSLGLYYWIQSIKANSFRKMLVYYHNVQNFPVERFTHLVKPKVAKIGKKFTTNDLPECSTLLEQFITKYNKNHLFI